MVVWAFYFSLLSFFDGALKYKSRSKISTKPYKTNYAAGNPIGQFPFALLNTKIKILSAVEPSGQKKRKGEGKWVSTSASGFSFPVKFLFISYCYTKKGARGSPWLGTDQIMAVSMLTDRNSQLHPYIMEHVNTLGPLGEQEESSRRGYLNPNKNPTALKSIVF